MSDETVTAEMHELQRLYPNFVYSNGTIEHNLLIIQLLRDIYVLEATLKLQNDNLYAVQVQMLSDIQSFANNFGEFREWYYTIFCCYANWVTGGECRCE